MYLFEYPELIHMHNILVNETVPLKHDLPNEIWHKIFLELDVRSISQCNQVCRRWFHISNDENLWKALLCKYHPHMSGKYEPKVFFKFMYGMSKISS